MKDRTYRAIAFALIWVVAGVAAGLIVAVTYTSGKSWGEERGYADACWDRGGVPVQGDENEGRDVICLDEEAVLQ